MFYSKTKIFKLIEYTCKEKTFRNGKKNSFINIKKNKILLRNLYMRKGTYLLSQPQKI